MTNCDEAARGPDKQRLVDVASIPAAGILRPRDRQSLPGGEKTGNRGDSSLSNYDDLVTALSPVSAALNRFGIRHYVVVGVATRNTRGNRDNPFAPKGPRKP